MIGARGGPGRIHHAKQCHTLKGKYAKALVLRLPELRLAQDISQNAHGASHMLGGIRSARSVHFASAM